MSLVTSVRALFSGRALEREGYYQVHEDNSWESPKLPVFTKTQTFYETIRKKGCYEQDVHHWIHRFVFFPSPCSAEYAEFLEDPFHPRHNHFYSSSLISAFDRSLKWRSQYETGPFEAALGSSIPFGAILGAVSAMIHLKHPQFLPFMPVFSSSDSINISLSLSTGALCALIPGLVVAYALDRPRREDHRADFHCYLEKEAEIVSLDTASALEAALRPDPLCKKKIKEPTHLNIQYLT